MYIMTAYGCCDNIHTLLIYIAIIHVQL